MTNKQFIARPYLLLSFLVLRSGISKIHIYCRNRNSQKIEDNRNYSGQNETIIWKPCEQTSPYKCPAGTECTMEREVQLNAVHKYKAIPSFQEKT